MPEFKVEELSKLAMDAVYVTVGLGVIAFQKVQVQRQELRKQFGSQLDDARKLVEDRVKLVEERLEGVEGRFESLLDQLEERLPAQAKEVAKQARQAAKEARGQIRDLTGRRSASAA